MCRSLNLQRLVLFDRLDQGFLPMKQLLGGTHFARQNSISSPKANPGDVRSFRWLIFGHIGSSAATRESNQYVTVQKSEIWTDY
jgi:hypothetical protein